MVADATWTRRGVEMDISIQSRSQLEAWARRELGKTNEELEEYSTEDLRAMREVDEWEGFGDELA